MPDSLRTRLPEVRLRALSSEEVAPERSFVLYWMIAARRPHDNFALDRAVELARELDKPLVVLEALRCGYRWASDRLHQFVLDGMAANAKAFEKTKALYYPYVEAKADEGKGLLAELSKHACAVVTDDFPCFFLPRMLEAAAEQVAVSFEAVDSNGLLPLRATDRVFARAVDFRRFLQKELVPHLSDFPDPEPLKGKKLPELDSLPKAITERWPVATREVLAGETLSSLPIDHDVPPVETRGGIEEGRRRVERFLESRLEDYEDRNHPDTAAASELSPYLHFGYVSPHTVVRALAEQIDWSPDDLESGGRGQREGWWKMPANCEAFMDQLVTWRELGYNFTAHRDDYDTYESLPDWARETLEEHASDPRPDLYELEQFERAETHDDIWNAAQRELLERGTIQNYLRMLWGKKVLHWTREPEEALEILIELNNKYALDGRNPNSYSGIFWVFGRFDRAWGPERPIFGKIRYMTSDSTKRKLRLGDYLERYASTPTLFSS